VSVRFETDMSEAVVWFAAGAGNTGGHPGKVGKQVLVRERGLGVVARGCRAGITVAVQHRDCHIQTQLCSIPFVMWGVLGWQHAEGTAAG